MKNQEVTLQEVLLFREKKYILQTQLSGQKKGNVVASLGMNIPGPIKNGPLIREAFLEGKQQLEELIKISAAHIEGQEILEERAGFAAVYLLSGIDAIKLKEKTVELEENHPLGRIYDLDITDKEGNAVGRETVGAARRKCFICGQDAKVCGRSRSHSVEQLQSQVFSMMENWKAGRQ